VGGVYVGRGQEAIPVGTALVAEPGDVLFPSHRDMAVFLIRGITAGRILAQYMGRAGGVSAAATPTCTWRFEPQYRFHNQRPGGHGSGAAGAALALRYQGSNGVVFPIFGEGSTSRGDWHEGVNFATVQKLRWCSSATTISTPTRRQSPCKWLAPTWPTAARLTTCRPKSSTATTVLAVYEATRRAVEHARRGNGPYLLECKTLRMTGHSAHDAAHYVPKDLLDEWGNSTPSAVSKPGCWLKAGAPRRIDEGAPPFIARWTKAWRGRREPLSRPRNLLDGCTRATTMSTTSWKPSAKGCGRDGRDRQRVS